VTAAEALGRSQHVGAIAVGRFGDLIAVAGDPLADVGILQAVAFVMKGGTVVKQTMAKTLGDPLGAAPLGGHAFKAAATSRRR
jgi:hypothetical protein